jgi:flagellar hook-associated protein 1 FlgK
MAGISSLLSIGRSALNASQVAIQVTGNNIANVDTEGYSRQSVVLTNGTYTSGVDVEGVTRSYDAFVEAQYLDKLSARDRCRPSTAALSGVEALFNRIPYDGLNASLSDFSSDWSDLTSSTASNASITAMLENSQPW